MKIKTSVSIDERVLSVIRREARKQDRSVSYILTHFLEQKVRRLRQRRGERQSDRALAA
jgi:hypothetical protein